MSNESPKSESIYVGVSPETKETLKEEASERSMTATEYIRVTLTAGRKQIVALEEEVEGNDALALEREVLNAVPTDSSDALSHVEISEEVLEKVEEQVFELLDKDDRITHSASEGGYYLK